MKDYYTKELKVFSVNRRIKISVIHMDGRFLCS